MNSRIFRAPGRVNLIGEHTDYNLGFVLPIALNLATLIETRPSPDDCFHVRSEQHAASFSWPASQTSSLTRQTHWSDYIAGVARELVLRGIRLQPLEMTIRSTVPEGSGLSSSAALEVSSALALLQGREFDHLELAKLCRYAETDFVGMPCGIMDQYVSLFGQERSAIRIDCRSLEHVTVALPPDMEIIAVNSMVKHELGVSAYRMRVQECADAAQVMGVGSLRDATLGQVDSTGLAPVLKRRARHIVTENRRVEDFVEAAAAGDLIRMGKLFVESHNSMRYDYEISCEEVDYLVDAALAIDGCYGARMTGGGFGGCTVNLLRPAAAELFRQSISDQYSRRFGIQPVVFRCVPGAGAGEITKDC